MDPLSNQEIRKFITTHFSDSELETFCFDYFPEVLNDFSDGMRKNKKVMDLVIYCRNRKLTTNLLTNLRQERQTVYQQAFNLQDSFFAPPINVKPRDPKQIFISYSTKDAAPLATRLAKDLRNSGHPVWIAPESIIPGEKWGEAIDRGLQESGIFVLLLTPAAVDSFWVKKEMYAAMRLHERGQMRVLPLDVQACMPPPLWEDYQSISFRDGYKKGRTQLWGALAGQPVAPPLRRMEPPPPAKKPPATKQPRPVSEKTDSFASQWQELPDWMQWGGIVMVLLFVFGMGYAIFGGGGDVPTATPALDIGSTDVRAKDGAVMVYVPAGEFEMGSDDGGSDEKPIHEVYLDSYWIDQTEVTNEMYAVCVEDDTCAQPSDFSSRTRDDYYSPNYADYPVIYVSWNDAVAYCEWAGGRLPTEAEWEYAARGTDGNIYPWGNESPNADLLNYNRNVGDTTAVGSYSPNGDSWVGASDMAGNVWEWTSTPYQPYPYNANDGREDMDSTSKRVLRGGAWFSFDYYARAAFRGSSDPDYRYYDIGFRCAQE